ncbi:histidinol-phosphatase HisJ family protein [uncultured Clostridium sp.]|uniref:histidinol-phosphatase HisJ family protein n=1 Tax=uncultured Clostridium sp. TaxID=59620 RepID=UPI0025ED1986|nr:histidinol-phosphatase HisJ family protein [uncultured Clostridium sp.]
MNYLSDYHMHSKYSFDAMQTIEQAVEKAISMNINEICMTEHISFDPDDKSYNYFNFKDYENEIDELSIKYRNKIKIKTGLEAGEIHLYKNEYNKCFSENRLDFIIGSIHNINRKGLNTNIRENGVHATYENYFNQVLILAQEADFDVLGHLDLIQRYAFNVDGVYDFNNYKEIIHEILKTLIAKGKGIEVNTSGLKNNLLFPKLEILQMYKDLKGEIITVGSDSHNYDRVGENIESTYNLLKDMGFKYVFTFENRKPDGIIL